MADDVDRLREILVGGGKYFEEEFAALVAGWDRREPLLQHLVAARVLDRVGARTVETVLKGYVTLPRGVLLALFAPPGRTGAQVREQIAGGRPDAASVPTRPRTPSREEVRAAVSAAISSAGMNKRAGPEGQAEKVEGTGQQSDSERVEGAGAREPGRAADLADGAGPMRQVRGDTSAPTARRTETSGPRRPRTDSSGPWRTVDGVRTLEELVAIAGPLDAAAVARIGADLAWDLWASGGHGEVRAGRVLVAGTGASLGARLAGSRRGGDVREDMLALGATLFYAATGREPPRGRGLAAQELAVLPGFSPAVAQVIAGLLRGRSDARADAWEQVIAALRAAVPAGS